MAISGFGVVINVGVDIKTRPVYSDRDMEKVGLMKACVPALPGSVSELLSETLGLVQGPRGISE